MSSASGSATDSQVVELASNDGYLLQYFRERRIPVLGVEPAANVADVALQKGIPTLIGVLWASRRHARSRRRRAPTCCSATTCSRTCRT